MRGERTTTDAMLVSSHLTQFLHHLLDQRHGIIVQKKMRRDKLHICEVAIRQESQVTHPRPLVANKLKV